jgi:hypothetical protein
MPTKLPLTIPTVDELREMSQEERFGVISNSIRTLSQFNWDYPEALTPYHSLKFLQWDIPLLQQLISRVVQLTELDYNINGEHPPLVQNRRNEGIHVGMSSFGAMEQVNAVPQYIQTTRATGAPPATDRVTINTALQAFDDMIRERAQRALDNAARPENPRIDPPEQYTWTTVRAGQSFSRSDATQRTTRGYGTEGT